MSGVSDEHIEEMYGEMLGNISPEPTDDELRQVYDSNLDLRADAEQWGWGDSV